MIDPQVPPGESRPDESVTTATTGESIPDRPDAASTPGEERPPLDLERVTADLDGVEAALGRLDEGTYWTDEVTGQPIPDDVLATNPVARRTEVAE